jgi:predicted DNA-binding transcriptional regulator YafY
LEDKTDEAHPATVADIVAYLSELGIAASRRTVTLDMEQLMEAGYDVIDNKGRSKTYFMGDRCLEMPEIKLLVDAVQASKFLTTKRSRALIDKLLTLASPYQAESLKSGLYLEKQAKPSNDTAYITADLLLTAINTKRRVRFMYFEYGPDKKKTYKHGRRVYELSPWTFVWDSDKYYIVGFSKTHGKAAKFRVDRIANPKLMTDLPAVPAPDDFDIAAFVQSVFQMYDGPMLDVTLKCRNEWMKALIDRFGEGVHTTIADTGHFTAKVSVAASATFYGWVFASDGAVEITAPAAAVKGYRDMLGRACMGR